MQTTTIDSLTRNGFIQSIALYQKHISPRKGFSCAHRLLYNDRSCSDYIKGLLQNQSLLAVAPLAYQRFHACAEASRILSRSSGSGFQCYVIPCCLPL